MALPVVPPSPTAIASLPAAAPPSPSELELKAAAVREARLAEELASAAHRIERLQLKLETSAIEAQAAELERTNAESLAASATARLHTLEAEKCVLEDEREEKRAAIAARVAAEVSSQDARVVDDGAAEKRAPAEEGAGPVGEGGAASLQSTPDDGAMEALEPSTVATANEALLPGKVAETGVAAAAAEAGASRRARYTSASQAVQQQRRVHVNRHGSISIGRAR